MSRPTLDNMNHTSNTGAEAVLTPFPVAATRTRRPQRALRHGTKCPSADDSWHSRARPFLPHDAGRSVNAREGRVTVWDWSGHMNNWWWLMAPAMVAFWAVVIWAVIRLARTERPDQNSSIGAEALLAERLASGDIDEVEYRRRRALIRS